MEHILKERKINSQAQDESKSELTRMFNWPHETKHPFNAQEISALLMGSLSRQIE